MMKIGKMYLIATAALAVACTGGGRSAFVWTADSVVNNKNGAQVDLVFPMAQGDEVAERINQQVVQSLLAGMGVDTGKAVSQTLLAAVDSLWAEHEQDTVLQRMPFMLSSNYTLYEKGGITSLFLSQYVYLGGAHGMPTGRYFNFDNKTGVDLSIGELITDTAALSGLNREAFAAYLKSKGGENVEGYLFVKPDALPLPQNIGFDSTGVVMYYNRYEIAAYVFGDATYVIPYEKVNSALSEILKP